MSQRGKIPQSQPEEATSKPPGGLATQVVNDKGGGFNRSVVVRYHSFLESLSLSAATINLYLSAIRRLADGSAESGWLIPEMAIGIRCVKGVKLPGRRIGNWLTSDQAQRLLNVASHDTLLPAIRAFSGADSIRVPEKMLDECFVLLTGQSLPIFIQWLAVFLFRRVS